MPIRPPRICGCGHRIAHGEPCPCEVRHAKARQARVDRARGSARQRGYTSKWEKESKVFLALPGNSRCACGCGRIADVVDHKVAHKGDQRLFWSRSNWQPMAKSCNSRKAVRSEGGFGNPVKVDGRQAMSEASRERSRPLGLRPSAIPLTIVFGPPAGGKTTYVQERAGPDDLVIDLDVIRMQVSGLPMYQGRQEWVEPALLRRNALLRSLATDTAHARAWFIVSAPTREERQWWTDQLKPVHAELLAPPLDVCIDRITRDARRSGQHEAFIGLARQWFERAASEEAQAGGWSTTWGAPPRTAAPHSCETQANPVFAASTGNCAR